MAARSTALAAGGGWCAGTARWSTCSGKRAMSLLPLSSREPGTRWRVLPFRAVVRLRGRPFQGRSAPCCVRGCVRRAPSRDTHRSPLYLLTSPAVEHAPGRGPRRGVLAYADRCADASAESDASGDADLRLRSPVLDQTSSLPVHAGRAEAKTADSQRRAVSDAPRDQADGLSALSAGEQQAWRAAVAFYARGPSRKDALFDGDMVAIGRQLVAAGDRPSLDSVGAVDPRLVDVLRRAAPLYRQAWWPRHDQANVALIQRLTELVGQHGETVRTFITRAYGERWPAGGFAVHVAAYANWAGAFSTAAGVLVVSSQDPATGGLHGLEFIVHEAMHQWDDAMYTALSREAQRVGTTVPDALSHAIIFFTAGQAVPPRQSGSRAIR